jgi:hypothetical protein
MAKARIELPKVVEFFEDKDAGDRVDRVFRTLIRELADYRAARTYIDSVGGTLRVVDWGTAAATEQAWIEVIRDETTTGYIRIYATP